MIKRYCDVDGKETDNTNNIKVENGMNKHIFMDVCNADIDEFIKVLCRLQTEPPERLTIELNKENREFWRQQTAGGENNGQK